LLEAYLDRRFAGWRAASQDDLNAGREVQRATASMTEEEAYEILGLTKAATREDITRAHRTLIKKLHPDHGGTTALAAKVNEAKSILMRRHD
jgi:DnaJ-class molecular chaperone